MKIRTIIVFLLSVLTNTLVGCDHSDSGKNNGSGYDNGTSFPTPIPVYETGKDGDEYWEGLIFQDKKGNIVKFDNEADYTSYVELCFFLKQLGYITSDLHFSFQKEEIVEGDKLWRVYIKSTLLYLNGDSEKIKNPKVKRDIEKFYYDNSAHLKKFRMDPDKTKEMYNFKGYMWNLNLMGQRFEYPLGFTSTDKYEDGTSLHTIDGPVPEGALLFKKDAFIIFD